MGLMGPRFAKFQVLLEKINSIAKENLRGVRVVKSFVQEREQYQKFTQVSDELLEQNRFIGYAFSIVQPMMMIVGYGAVYLTMWLLSSMIQMDPGLVSSIVSFISYLNYVYHHHGWLSGQYRYACNGIDSADQGGLGYRASDDLQE